MTEHIADPEAPRPRVHHYMNADGTCHPGDLFECGNPSIALYAAEELVRIFNAEKAEAWEQGWQAAWSPMAMRNRNEGPNPYTSPAPEGITAHDDEGSGL